MEIIPTTNNPVASGVLSRYLTKWSKITSNNFILRIISEGYKIQFVENPSLPAQEFNSNKNRNSHPAIQEQVQKFLASGAISNISFSSDLILSRVFTVKKSNGKDRMIIDLSNLNKQISKVSFKMESHSKLIELIENNDFMASIDLADAFFHISLHPSHRKFVAFEWEGKFYHFNVLPFGLTSSTIFFKSSKTSDYIS